MSNCVCCICARTIDEGRECVVCPADANIMHVECYVLEQAESASELGLDAFSRQFRDDVLSFTATRLCRVFHGRAIPVGKLARDTVGVGILSS